MVDISIIEEDKKKVTMSFELKKSTPAFANTLRRAIMTNVYTMAIEDVEISKNSSILYDEIIAHRLGLIPLTTDLKTYNPQSECKCKGEGCARCTVQLSLKAKGPGIVKAGSIESKDPKVVPAYTEMPITKLTKGQEIEFIATAALGTGRDHAKFSPGNVWYTYKPVITVNSNSKDLEEFKEKYPQSIFDKSGKIDKKLITEPSIIDACDGINEDIVKIEYDNTSFVFYVESYGQLNCKEMVEQALVQLDKDLDEFVSQVKKQ